MIITPFTTEPIPHQRDLNMLGKGPKACVDTKVTHYVVGGRFYDAPIHHDILRQEYWIYNQEIEEIMQMSGWTFRFVKFEKLPTTEETELVEWRTLDLMNNFFYSHTTRMDEISDLVQALCSYKLDIQVMLNLASKYVTAEARRVLDEAMERSGLKNQLDT